MNMNYENSFSTRKKINPSSLNMVEIFNFFIDKVSFPHPVFTILNACKSLKHIGDQKMALYGHVFWLKNTVKKKERKENWSKMKTKHNTD
jgi:hypothetical protein